MYHNYLTYITSPTCWLRHCATRRKVAVSIPDSVTGVFHRHNPSSPTMPLGLTQSLTEMSTRNISFGGGGKYDRCVGLTAVPSAQTVSQSRSLKFLRPAGPVKVCTEIGLPLPLPKQASGR